MAMVEGLMKVTSQYDTAGKEIPVTYNTSIAKTTSDDDLILTC